MNELSPREVSMWLSQYLDGVLSKEEQESVERYAAEHPEAAKELRDLRKAKRLVASRRSLPPDPYFWTRLSARLDSEEEEEKNFLPFSRKHIPLASALAIIAVLGAGVTIFLQREPLFEYFSRQSQAVKEAYESKILKGSILPLFAKIDNDKVLQFALFGTLPLDDKAETALRVDQGSEQGYKIEVGMTAAHAQRGVTVKDLYREVLPTRTQEQLIDSLLGEARSQIAKGAFYAENNALALDPGLVKLNRAVLSNIAAVLAPVQRVRFDKFLNRRKAIYTVTESSAQTPAVLEVAWKEINAEKGARRFVVITPDSCIIARLHINMDSLVRPEVASVPSPSASMELPARLEGLLKARFERRGDVRLPPRAPQPSITTTDQEDFFKVEFAPQFFSQTESMRVWVTPRKRTEKMFRYEHRMPGVAVQVFAVPGIETGFDMDVSMRKMDSLMRKFTEEQLQNDEQFRRLDSLVRAHRGKLTRAKPGVKDQP